MSLPTPPMRSDGPATFADRGDAFMSALPAFETRMEAIDANVSVLGPAAVAAAATVGATAWVSGATYAIGDARYSLLDMQTYRRKTAGAGTTDPSADATNWTRVQLTPQTLVRSARTSNTALAYDDRASLIDITSGTFTQTFATAATLGSGWFCYIRNAGTGDITLDPSASELIDGLTSYVMYPGETRLIQCEGTGFYSVVLTSFSRTYTTSGTFIKPPGYLRFAGLLWSGGGGGGSGAGGGGGACSPLDLPASAVGTTQTVTIGAGGTAGTPTTGGQGGSSTFVYTSIGGYGGSGATGGYGGDALNTSRVSNPTPSPRLAGTSSAVSTYSADYGGGGGHVSFAYSGVSCSIYGGAGGTLSGTQQTSVYGGNGGVGAVAGTAPGGGGGGHASAPGAGARGELRLWGIL